MIPNKIEAEILLNKYVKNNSLLTHSKIVSGILGYFADKYAINEKEYWEVVGLLHDIDFELYPDQHCQKCVEILREHHIDEFMIQSIITHGYGRLDYIKEAPTTQLEKVLFATDELSGLITACALVRPSKSVDELDVKSIFKKYKTMNFATGINRKNIETGAKLLEISLDELIHQTLSAMKYFPHVFNNCFNIHSTENG